MEKLLFFSKYLIFHVYSCLWPANKLASLFICGVVLLVNIVIDCLGMSIWIIWRLLKWQNVQMNSAYVSGHMDGLQWAFVHTCSRHLPSISLFCSPPPHPVFLSSHSMASIKSMSFHINSPSTRTRSRVSRKQAMWSVSTPVHMGQCRIKQQLTAGPNNSYSYCNCNHAKRHYKALYFSSWCVFILKIWWKKISKFHVALFNRRTNPVLLQYEDLVVHL